MNLGFPQELAHFMAAVTLTKQNVLPAFFFTPHLSSQAVQHLLQPRSVQLQRDGEQLLSEPEDQRLQLGNARQQLPGSGALVPRVRDGAGERDGGVKASKQCNAM